MRFLVAILLAALGAAASPAPATAHALNQSYLFFNVSDAALGGRVEVALADIGSFVDIDTDADGRVTKDEVEAGQDRLFAFFAARLGLRSGGSNHDFVFSGVDFLGVPEGTFAQMLFDIPSLGPVPEAVEISYDVPPSAPAGHLGYAIIESNTRTGVEGNEGFISLVFEPGVSQTLSLVAPNRAQVFVDFVVHGIWHIWLGFDHVIFILALLLPAVLTRDGDRWRPAPQFREAFINVVKIVTVFTLSHSVTLTLSALDIVRLPSSIVETVIALSIVAIALGNLLPGRFHHGLWVVFVFGLFHGFGFASVLAPLGVDPAAMIVSLVGFNVGVELGQLAIVVVLFPILYALRGQSFYDPVILRVASVVFILVAGLWAFERSVDVVVAVQDRLGTQATG